MVEDSTLDAFLGEDSGDAEDSEPIEEDEDSESIEEDEDSDPNKDADPTGETGSTDRPGSADGDQSTPRTVPAEPSSVEPATSTFEWTPQGRECAACGVVTRRRFRDGDLLVCPDCKSWSDSPDRPGNRL